jgi:bifunctional DNase/RNase
MVEMHLAAVRVEMATNTPILLLQETGEGHRTLPIYIGPSEAQAIAQALQKVVTPRPMTHDLMRDLLVDLEASVDFVVITELRDRTFYAEIRLTSGGRAHTVSARPSDAVALAVRTSSRATTRRTRARPTTSCRSSRSSSTGSGPRISEADPPGRLRSVAGCTTLT